jgi:hypothetical protein
MRFRPDAYASGDDRAVNAAPSVAARGAWNTFPIAAAVYRVPTTAAGLALPIVNEVPKEFPALLRSSAAFAPTLRDAPRWL